MVLIRELIKNKPSVALQAMVNGLQAQSNRDDFRIRMSTYGAYGGGICYGCAATCALQELAQVNFDFPAISSLKKRAAACSFSYEETDKFEAAIDNARLGELAGLFRFCEIPYMGGFDFWFCLEDYSWVEELGKVEKAIAEMKQLDL
jgi:hypothetical protein